ncbi:unnamed protein product, partial [Ranitomeya imitator]
RYYNSHSLSLSAGSNTGAVDEMLDAENKRLSENLSTKVTRLKSLALDIDREADDHNNYLDGMDSDFMSVTGLLSGSVKRFTGMARSGRDNRKLLCYVCLPGWWDSSSSCIIL